jgi:hypothetical protein
MCVNGTLTADAVNVDRSDRLANINLSHDIIINTSVDLY